MKMASRDKIQKVTAFETFLNEKLREDLRKVLDQRDALYAEMSEYLQLKATIEKIKDDLIDGDGGGELKTKVDLGCNFYVQANVPDPTMICVAIGYGFFLDMTLDEALQFIEKKTKMQQDQASELTEKACRIKSHIKLVLEGLRELQHISPATTKEYRDVLS